MGLKNKVHNEYLYFLTMTIVDWVDIFTRAEYKHIIIDSLKYCQNNKGLEIYGWCLMSNHLHLIAGTSKNHKLSDTIRDFKKFTNKQIILTINSINESRKKWVLNRFEFAGRYNKKIKHYKVWQEGNEPKEIHNAKFAQQKLDYIHENPVKAEWVAEPQEYLYSSAKDYAGGKGLINVILMY